MTTELFVSIDFDGTITDADVTDEIIRNYARPGWEEAERLWEQGVIGSKECLKTQFSLVDAPASELMRFTDSFAVDRGFKAFIAHLRRNDLRFAVISDGFKVFIDNIMRNNGLTGIPVYANRLREKDGRHDVSFPYANANCPSGVCKYDVALALSEGAPLIHIGDGRSDFCISEEARLVYSKGKLTGFCRDKGIPHIEFTDFSDVRKSLAAIIENARTFEPGSPNAGLTPLLADNA